MIILTKNFSISSYLNRIKDNIKFVSEKIEDDIFCEFVNIAYNKTFSRVQFRIRISYFDIIDLVNK